MSLNNDRTNQILKIQSLNQQNFEKYVHKIFPWGKNFTYKYISYSKNYKHNRE